MLPRFTKEEKCIEDELMSELLNAMKSELGIFDDLPKRHYEEGDKHGSGSPDNQRGFKEIAARAVLTKDDCIRRNKDDLREEWRKMGRDMAHQESMVIQTLMNEVDEHVFYKFHGTDASENLEESILDAIATVPSGFDDQGFLESKFHAKDESTRSAINCALENIQRDPNLRKRFNDIIQRKYEEFRDQQASRRLVD